MLRWRLVLVALIASPALASDHSVQITSFDRIRVEGPFDVRLSVGGAPGARVEGDAAALDALDIRVEGQTLTVRKGAGGWGERGSAKGAAPVIRLSTPALRAANVDAGGRLTIDRVRAQRADVSVNGSGMLSIGDAQADQLNATMIGAGTITLAGRVARATLLTNGSGAIEAAGLDVGDLIVRLEGQGQTHAAARFTAKVTSTGLGGVTVGGNPACTVNAVAVGPVTCGQGKQDH